MPHAMAVIVNYTVFQRSPISQWTAGTTIVETTTPFSFNDLVAGIETHMKLNKGSLTPSHFLGIIENKLVANKTSILPPLPGSVQVCVAERSAYVVQQFPAVARA